MRIPYLVQRCKQHHTPRENKNTIFQHVELDYMGSAEFEFGAIPLSLARMVLQEQIVDGEFAPKKYNFRRQQYHHAGSKVDVSIWCPEGDADMVMLDYIPGLICRKYMCKERTSLPDIFEGNSRCRDINFWWDIQNDYMFWVNHTEEFNNTIIRELSVGAGSLSGFNDDLKCAILSVNKCAILSVNRDCSKAIESLWDIVGKHKVTNG